MGRPDQGERCVDGLTKGYHENRPRRMSSGPFRLAEVVRAAQGKQFPARTFWSIEDEGP
jgi:hypothetical protein